MTREDVIRWADMAGVMRLETKSPAAAIDRLEQFAGYVRDAALEEAAQVCENRYVGDNNREDMEARRLAAAIRSQRQDDHSVSPVQNGASTVREGRDYGVLHVYPQYAHHCEAYIAGTRAELRGLRDTIDEALVLGDGEMLTFANDGEGYDVSVVLVSDEEAARLFTAYSADYAEDNRRDGLHPWRILVDRYFVGPRRQVGGAVEAQSERAVKCTDPGCSDIGCSAERAEGKAS